MQTGSLPWLPLAAAFALFFIVGLCHGCGNTNQCTTYHHDLNLITSHILERQYTNASLPRTFGAIRLGTAPGVYQGDVAWYNINPYFSALGLRGVLEQRWAGVLNETMRSKALRATEAWLDFTLSHLSPDGYPWDWWINADGTNDTSCIAPGVPLQCDHADSEDSYTAVILSISWLYYLKGGNSSFISRRMPQIEAIADKLVALTDTDNLTIALRSYAIKYTMDNAEAWWAMDAMANLGEAFFSRRAMLYRSKADALQEAMLTLYNSNFQGGRWKYFKDNGDGAGNCDGSSWYPKTTPVVWPAIFGVVQKNSTLYTTSQIDWINSLWNGTAGKQDWTVTQPNAPFWWPSVTYAAVLAGSCTKATNSISSIKNAVFPTLPSPWNVADSGFLLLAISELFTSACGGAAPSSSPSVSSVPSSTNAPVARLSPRAPPTPSIQQTPTTSPLLSPGALITPPTVSSASIAAPLSFTPILIVLGFFCILLTSNVF